MVVHVYERARKAAMLDDVIVAIDHKETASALNAFKVKTVMTREDHNSGSDRVYEVGQSLDADVLVNIQGDEPGLDPQIIDNLVRVFEEETIEMATAANYSLKPEDALNPNVVKVFLDSKGFAKSFCRELPSLDFGGYYQHIGLYAYRKNTLKSFTKLPKSENETELNLEQMRALDNGISIKVILTHYANKGVDTPEDLKQFEEEQ